jgi:hypothetical protein
LKRTRVATFSIMCVATLAVIAALATADDAAGPWVLEPGPERAGATEGGAADVARAQKLAKQKKMRDAVTVFEKVAREWPSAVHDCNLALAYLRAGAYTRAQLVWEISALRNADRPGWCTATLGEQLSTALRSAGYVPVTLDVVPSDAVVEIGGVTVRRMRIVWLAPGHYAVSARANGRVDGRAEVDVASPSATVSIQLDAPPAETPLAPDAGVVVPEAAADAAPVVEPKPPHDDRMMLPVPAEPPPKWPGYVALGAGGVAIATGLVFHMRALDSKDAANQLRTDDPRFAEEVDRFESRRVVAIGGYVIGAIAAGIGAWWLLDHAAETGPQVGASVSGDGASVTLGWELP